MFGRRRNSQEIAAVVRNGGAKAVSGAGHRLMRWPSADCGRRRVLLAIGVALIGLALTATAGPSHAAEPSLSKPHTSHAGVAMHVYKTRTCGCCQAWADHMRAAGFVIKTENMGMSPLVQLKSRLGVPVRLAACHTARVGGYVIEGHVPAREVKRLLREQPDAIGLSVPGMPIGSPGMESDTERDAYEVLLITKDGKTRVFATYSARD